MKYKLNPPLIQLDHYLQQLEDQSKQGWKLVRVGFINKYERCNQPVKYQILNEKPNEELLDTLEKLGYCLIDEYQGMYYFYNEDMDAVDLYTDREFLKQQLLKKNSILGIFLTLLVTPSLYLADLLVSKNFGTNGGILSNQTMIVFLLFLAFTNITICIISLMNRYLIKNDLSPGRFYYGLQYLCYFSSLAIPLIILIPTLILPWWMCLLIILMF